jgi:hypothetical protein
MEAGDQYLAVVGQAQEDFLKAMAAFKPYVPDFPAARPAGFPSPQEVVEVSFSFAEKLLRQQQDFTAKMLGVAEARTESSIPRTVGPKTKGAPGPN